jgi:hypothetical protein
MGLVLLDSEARGYFSQVLEGIVAQGLDFGTRVALHHAGHPL